MHQNAALCGNGLTLYQYDEILDQSKLKAFADDKIKLAKIKIFVLNSAENIVGKGENAGYQHFLVFPQCFFKGFVVSQDCVVKR